MSSFFQGYYLEMWIWPEKGISHLPCFLTVHLFLGYEDIVILLTYLFCLAALIPIFYVFLQKVFLCHTFWLANFFYLFLLIFSTFLLFCWLHQEKDSQNIEFPNFFSLAVFADSLLSKKLTLWYCQSIKLSYWNLGYTPDKSGKLRCEVTPGGQGTEKLSFHLPTLPRIVEKEVYIF